MLKEFVVFVFLAIIFLLPVSLNIFLIGKIENNENIIVKIKSELLFPVKSTIRGTNKKPIIDAITSPIPSKPINLLLCEKLNTELQIPAKPTLKSVKKAKIKANPR